MPMPSLSPSLTEALELAERELRAAAEAVACADVPAFVTTTAHAQLRWLATQIAEVRGGEADGADFASGFAMALEELETSLDFGREVLAAAREADARLATFEHRVATQALEAMLVGPVEDQLEVLREMRHRLESGLFPLAEFKMDFEQAEARLEALLACPGLEAPLAHEN